MNIVITGSDTGVGKTWVGCALARALVSRGRSVVAIKPLESGCDERVSDGEDGVLLARATGQAAPRQALLRLRTPVSPAEAADREGVTLDYDALLAQLRAPGTELTLIEGAGGALSPLTWSRTVVDLARDLDARVLVVSADRLGTVNHTLLTLRALSGLDVLGVVLTAPASPDASTGSNAAALRRLANARVHEVGRGDDDLRAVAAWIP